MSRAALATLSLQEGIESFDQEFVKSASDGVIDADELRRLLRKWSPIPRKSARVHRSLGFVALLIQGDGCDGQWIQRKWKEDVEQRANTLRVVAWNDDPDPDPAGPTQKAA